MNKYVIGIDFGTDSCRALLVDVITGEELASDVEFYPRWKKGLYCDPAINQYRQHPLDYMESMELAVRRTLSQCPEGTAEKVVGIAIDTTGSTPVLLDKSGMPLSLLPEYSDNPNAMFVLWKDHTAVKEAGEINDGKQILQHIVEVFILQNGCGLRCCICFVSIRQSGNLHIAGWSIVIGCLLC